MQSHFFSFMGGEHGPWRVTKIVSVTGDGLESVARLSVVNERIDTLPRGVKWILRGVTSYERYVNSAEHQELVAAQPPLNRPQATCAALIPIKKADSWWQLPQDERRRIFEERSSHIATGLKYLPAVARRLHHGYELGEPFDFLTWFEYAPDDAVHFEKLVTELRQTEEWRFVIREIDLRLERV
jgi:chlorite dismutase